MRPAAGVAVALVAAVALAAACSSDPATAPTTTASTVAPFDTGSGAPTGDAAADAVLALLDAAEGQRFTARYDLVRPLGEVTSTGTVVHDLDAAVVTVGDVRFFFGAAPRTCVGTACEDGIQDARVSDRLPMGAAFFAERPARVLRVSVGRRAGPTVASDTTVAGRPATCVTVPVLGGTERYCATDLGAVAIVERADVRITLRSIEPTVDQAALAG
jgi:hypothetical protein